MREKVGAKLQKHTGDPTPPLPQASRPAASAAPPTLQLYIRSSKTRPARNTGLDPASASPSPHPQMSPSQGSEARHTQPSSPQPPIVSIPTTARRPRSEIVSTATHQPSGASHTARKARRLPTGHACNSSAVQRTGQGVQIEASQASGGNNACQPRERPQGQRGL